MAKAIKGNGLTAEQAQQLQTAYEHSQSPHAPSNAEANVQADWNETNTASSAYIKNKPANLGGDVILTSPIGLQYKLIVSDEGVLSAEVIARYGEIIVNTTSLNVIEGGSTSFTVKLSQAPTDTQNVNVSVNNSYCSIDATTLTFNADNYSTPQTVTVTAVEDSVEANNTSTISLTSPNLSTVEVSIEVIDSDVTNNVISAPEVTKTFNIVSDLKKADLAYGDVVSTKGYYEIGDGGGADYIIGDYNYYLNTWLPVDCRKVGYKFNRLGTDLMLIDTPVD